MLTVRVIPCLDVDAGRVVKGVRFAGLEDRGDPTELATAYDAQGADELVFLDVSATPEGRETAAPTVERLRANVSIPITVGGGVRAAADARRLLESGADKVALNTAAVERPELLGDLASRFGTQCTVIAIDAAACDRPACPSGYEVVTRSGACRTGLDAARWATRAEGEGAGEVLLTGFDRDGTRAGYDLGLIAAIRRAVDLPIVASGGASTPEHMAEAVAAGADAVLAASIFHEREWTVGDVKQRLAALGVEVRR